MEICGSEVEPLPEKAGWRCVMIVSGGQFVMISGELLMPGWHAGSLDFPLMVMPIERAKVPVFVDIHTMYL